MTGKEIIIYTDGACSGNPGPGGWGAVLKYQEHVKEISGGEINTTNQRMELTAAIEALKLLKEPCSVHLHSDSAYLINAFKQQWLVKWRQNGWLTAQKKPVENRDLWLQLVELASRHQINWVKVKGHAGDSGNERCDLLARQAILHLSEVDGSN
jgi:ribonuclease HI